MDRTTILRRRLVAIAVAVGATALLWLLLFGSGGDDGGGPPELTIAKLSPETRARLAGLDTAAKVDQLLLAADPAPDSGPLGGVLVSSDAWTGAGTGGQLTKPLREAAGGELPAMVGTTQEGGNYRELADLPPAARAIEVGDSGDPKLAAEAAGETAGALQAEGFDFNIGPLADVATLDSGIADRAYSDDPATVDAMVAAAFGACRKAKFACIPAHFPGQGAAAENTSLGPATVSVDASTLSDRDIPPFEQAIARGAPAVVVSNAFFSAYDPVTPASLSPEILDGLLRRELGFEGVAITDQLEAGAIRSGYKTPEAAVAAIRSGADMVQLSEPGDIDQVRAALIAAVDDGAITTDRLDSAAGRVLEMKQGLGLLR